MSGELAQFLHVAFGIQPREAVILAVDDRGRSNLTHSERDDYHAEMMDLARRSTLAALKWSMPTTSAAHRVTDLGAP